MKPSPLVVAAISLAALLPSIAPAQPLVYEGFNGYSSGFLNGQTANANTLGLATAAITAGGSTNVNSYNATGLTLDTLPTSGGSARFTTANGAQSYIGWAYSGPTVTGTLYSSHLVNIEVAQNANSIVSLRVNTNSTAGAATSHLVTMADNAGGTFTGNQYDNASGTTASTQTLALNTTYVVIGRFTRVGESLSSGTPGIGTTYVLTAEQFATFKVDGFTDAELDAAVIGSGPDQVFSRVSDAAVTTGTYNTFVSGKGIQFGIGNAGTGVSQTARYDEIRYGLSLDEVLPAGPPGPAPDPALVSLTSTLPTATEATTTPYAPGRVTVNRLDASTHQVRVYFTVSGTATSGADYLAPPASVVLPAGAASASIDIKALADPFVEGDETIILTAIPGTGYTLAPAASATVTILDGPPPTKTRLIHNLESGLPQKVVVYGTSLTAGGAWSSQVKSALDAAYPGLTTLVNSGGSGENSVWGVANLQTKVINEAPSTVFIEFAVNDAVVRESYANRIPPAQARANLVSMINSILAALPNCEIILQVMNPVIGRPAGHDGYRPNLALCQQYYREVGKERGFLVIDHMPAWQALLDEGESAFYAATNPSAPEFPNGDGLHPTSAAYTKYVTPVILREIKSANNLAAGTVMLHANNHRAAEPGGVAGTSRATLLTVTRGGSTAAALPVNLTIGGSSTSGTDFPAIPAIPASLVIPAGASSATFLVDPQADGLPEGEETCTAGLAAGTGYTLASPNKASWIIEDLPFDSWRKASFTAPQLADPSYSGDGADPDADGIPNLLEFYLGRQPAIRDASAAVVTGTQNLSGQNYLTLSFTRSTRTGLAGVVETSSTLGGDWATGPGFVLETIQSDNGLVQSILARSLSPIGSKTAEFIRLRVPR